jgi:putative ABC transport system permease protein
VSRKPSARKENRAAKRAARRAGRGSVLRKVARAGASRRKLQSSILFVVTAGSVATALLAAQLLAGVDASFDQAFEQQHGSELTVQVDGAKAEAAQAAASAHAAGVTASAGPFPTVQATGYTATGLGPGGSALPMSPITVVGRASAGGPVDDVQLDAGHWPTAANQIVIENNASELDATPLGATVTFHDAPGSPTLTIVGFTTSVSETADAWVLPQEVAALTPAGTVPGYQMLYRFAAAGTDAQMGADTRAVRAALPAGSISDSQSWLVVRSADGSGGLGIIPPFLAMFGVLGVLLAVITLAGAVNASVAASLRRIGILKAVGCTPAQVMRAYGMQALIPCVFGVAVGTALGTLGATSLLKNTGRAMSTATPPLTLWVELLVPIAALGLVLGTALLAAGRAGRMSVLATLTAGHTPGKGRGLRAQRLLCGSRLPRPVSLGLAAPFARPVRAVALILSVAVGVLAVTLSVGVADSLGRATQDVAHGGDQGQGVEVSIGGEQQTGPPSAAQVAQALAAVKAQPGTEAYYSDVELQLPIAGLCDDATVDEYSGDASWSHYQLISGHWLTGDGQAVVPTHLLRAMDLHLGESLTVDYGRQHFPLTIVGEVFDTRQDGMSVLTDASNFAAVQSSVPLGFLSVEVAPGVDQATYIASLGRALAPSGSTVSLPQQGQNKLILIVGTLSVMLTLMLLGVAALGVAGSVVLETRERVHDIGVFKALGMTPRQTTGMVLSSVLALGLVAGLVGVPLGVLAHAVVLPLMGDAVQLTLPPDVLNVYHLAELALFALGGVAVALAAALGPAGWAGRIRTASALRTE